MQSTTSQESERTVGEKNSEHSWREEQIEQLEWRTMAIIRVKYIDPDDEE